MKTRPSIVISVCATVCLCVTALVFAARAQKDELPSPFIPEAKRTPASAKDDNASPAQAESAPLRFSVSKRAVKSEPEPLPPPEPGTHYVIADDGLVEEVIDVGASHKRTKVVAADGGIILPPGGIHVVRAVPEAPAAGPSPGEEVYAPTYNYEQPGEQVPYSPYGPWATSAPYLPSSAIPTFDATYLNQAAAAAQGANPNPSYVQAPPPVQAIAPGSAFASAPAPGVVGIPPPPLNAPPVPPPAFIPNVPPPVPAPVRAGY